MQSLQVPNRSVGGRRSSIGQQAASRRAKMLESRQLASLPLKGPPRLGFARFASALRAELRPRVLRRPSPACLARSHPHQSNVLLVQRRPGKEQHSRQSFSRVIKSRLERRRLEASRSGAQRGRSPLSIPYSSLRLRSRPFVGLAPSLCWIAGPKSSLAQLLLALADCTSFVFLSSKRSRLAPLAQLHLRCYPHLQQPRVLGSLLPPPRLTRKASSSCMPLNLLRARQPRIDSSLTFALRSPISFCLLLKPSSCRHKRSSTPTSIPVA